MRRALGWGLGLAIGLAGLPATAGAQAVRVRARLERDRRPVVGALVSVHDADGRSVKQALTDEAGRALLPVPPGRYRLRGDRIGYQGATTDVFTVTGTDTVVVNLSMPDVATAIADLEVVSAAPVVCSLDPAAAGPIAMLWTEARKALSAADLTSRGLPMLEVTRYERTLGAGSVITGERVERFRTDSVTPFVAADPARLAQQGYLERRGGDAVFYAPDAQVLLSDEFLADHCFFGLAARDSVDLVGLGFEPSTKRARHGADVRGTLWLDRESLELRFLEFSYTDLPKEFRRGDDGGRVDFVKLPGGGWLTGRWRARVAGRERGGELAVVGGRRGVAVISGQVFDSLSGTPLPDAVVSVGGGAYRDTTEADGRYRIEVPMGGEFSVGASHPRFTLVGSGSFTTAARLAPGAETTVDFALPSRATLEASRCPTRPVDLATESLLVGQVVDSAGTGMVGAVRVGWPAGVPLRAGQRLEVGEDGIAVNLVTDADGRFQVCGVPPGEVRASVTVGARRTEAPIDRVGPAVSIVRLVVP